MARPRGLYGLTPEQRFHKRYSVQLNGCWQWLGHRSGHGYGCIVRDGQKMLAHRFSYELYKGPIPTGTEIDHLCRNPPCVNPEHLEAVTHQVNLLRGVGPAARHALQTHCLRGHELSGNNLRVTPKGSRDCRACHRIRQHQYAQTSRLAGAEVGVRNGGRS